MFTLNEAPKNGTERIFPLTESQAVLWRGMQAADSRELYHMAGYAEIRQEVDRAAFEKALQQLLSEVDAMGISIGVEEDGIPFQHFTPQLDYELPFLDFSDSQTPAERCLAWIGEWMDEAIVIGQSPLYEFTLLKAGETHYFWLLKFHHLIFDEPSIALFTERFGQYYQHFTGLASAPIPGQLTSFRDYIGKEIANIETYKSSEAYEKELDFWIKKFKHLPAPLLKRRKGEHGNISLEKQWLIPPELQAKIDGLAEELNLPLPVLWVGILAAYFYKLGQNESLSIGLPIKTRYVKGEKNTIGAFVNILPFILPFSKEPTFVELLEQARETFQNDGPHWKLPISALREALAQAPASLGSFYDFALNFRDRRYFMDAFNVETVWNGRGALQKAPVAFLLEPDSSGNGWVLKVSFLSSYYSEADAELMAPRLEVLVNELVQNPNQTLSAINLLPEAERQMLLHDFNDTQADFPDDKTIVDLFEEQVERTPDHIAAVFEEKQLTYRELNQKSNQLARYIQKQTAIKPDTLIALCLDRSIEMIVGILGILKAGGAYVPIDPDYPEARIKYLFEDTSAKLVLTQSHLAKALKGISRTRLIVLDEGAFIEGKADNLPVQSKATNLAYVIFTSGTTGKPKGVMVEHRNVLALLEAEYFNCFFEKRALWTNYTFDVSVFEIFSALFKGSAIYIVDHETRLDAVKYFDFINVNRIDFAYIPPFFIKDLSNYAESKRGLVELRSILTGVDKIYYKDAVNIINHNISILNGYGPTETTVCSTSLFLDSCQHAFETLPIGRPINNERAYVLDANGKPVPIGVIGELHIGGAGLARGYLNRPELTQEKFIDNPFATKEDIKKGYTHLYKTGDLVRWLPDGNLEYIGRSDFQVKVRGYRIELGEIESALNGIPGVKQSCVLAKEKAGSKYLAAYYVAEAGKKITEETIIDRLSAQLPDYMAPNVFVALESFPLTVNDKLDRKALPDPDFTSEETYVAPATDLEQRLCNIWQEVLNLERVGIRDDFFRIGGDSILSIQLSSRLRKEGMNVSVKDVFEHRSIEKLANFIASDTAKTTIIAEQGILEGSFGLLPIQQWFFGQVERKAFRKFNHWNQSILVRVPKLEAERLQAAIGKLSVHHDILRVVYREQGQAYLAKTKVPQLQQLSIEKLSEKELHNTLTDWQSGFDIEQGPLWSVGYLEGFEDGSARLFFAFHHLIIDAVSLRIIIEDFKALYEGGSLDAKTSSYRQWVKEVSLYGEKHPKEKGYWDSMLSAMPQYSISEKERAQSRVELSRELTRSLLQESNGAYHSQVNDLLLTALALSLQTWNGAPTQYITLEGHGREDINSAIDHSRTAGWFTSMYPVKLEVQENLSSSIKHIKESLRAIPNKGIGFGAIYPNELSHLPPVSFNYLGQFDSREEYWQVADEASGVSMHADNEDSNIININGMVVDGKLSFSMVTALGQKETNRLSDAFKAFLEEVISHCREVIQQGHSYYTPSDFETASISQQLLDSLQGNKDNKIVHIYPANSLQQGFIYHALSQEADDAYRVQLLFDYRQELNLDQYIKAWELAVKRYPILRTAFNWEEELIQVVYDHADLNYEVPDISDLTEEEKKRYVVRLQQEDRTKGFDLSKPCLLRLYIIKLKEDHYTILRTEHHSISDGWSGPVLLDSVHHYYQQLQKGKKVKVEEDRSYLRAQEYISRERDGVEHYWKQKIAIAEQANDLNPLLSQRHDLDSIRSLEDAYNTSIAISGSLYNDLRQLTKKEGLTLNTLVQFAWHKLIQVYTQDQQTIVGTTVSGRGLPIEGIEESVGLYINTLPLIIDWDNGYTVSEQLRYLHEEISGINTHSFASLSGLQKEGNRLFHSLMVFDNYPVPESGNSNSDEDSLRPLLRYVITKLDYPLGITAYEQKNELIIILKTDHTVLEIERANYILDKLKLLLGRLTDSLDRPHGTLSILSPPEYDQIVNDWNEADGAYPKDKTIHQLFEEQAGRTPNNVAVVFEGRQLTYQELNEQANQLARYIQKQMEVKPDFFIALCLDRSIEMIVAILGVLKSGAAYVPIDPGYPRERIAYMIEDTGAKLILSQSHLLAKLHGITTAGLIVLDEKPYGQESAANLEAQSLPTNLAYVIYTSGTTGRPKGAMVEHRAINYYLTTFNKLVNIPEIVCAFTLNYCFDASLPTIFSGIISGGTVHVMKPLDAYSLTEYADYFRNNKINVTRLTPSILNSLHEQLLSFDQSLSIVLGGEAVDIAIINELIKNSNLTLYNQYGPTECTVGSTVHPLNSAIQRQVIGRGYEGKRIYVLDTGNQPAPVGVTGELHIGGAGMARGYLNRPELTAEKFISNPFASKADIEKGYTRLYKTGDLVRWLPDGNLEYVGRNDLQVKIRGYRVELGEIESALNDIAGIKQSCVLAKEKRGSKYLAAYYVAEAGKEIAEEAIIDRLSAQLPDYMAPGAFVQLDAFPLTVNGKLDRNALPDPEFTSEEAYVAPTTELEQRLCRVWEEVLDIEKVGSQDDFFRIGGDSILSIQLSSRLRKADLNVSVKDILEHRTIEKLADFINSGTDKTTIIAEQGILEGSFGLLPIQQWFFGRVAKGELPEYNHWNQSFLVRTPELEVGRLQPAMEQLCAHHDMLRAVYVDGVQAYRSKIAPPRIYYLSVKGRSEADIQRSLTRWQSSFDIGQGPSWSVGYLDGYEDGSARLFFAFHHLIIDTVSWRIIIEDFKTLYEGGSLGPKTSSYRQWVNEVSLYGEKHPKEKGYWDDILASIPQYSIREERKTQSSIQLSKDLTKTLLQEANEAYHSQVNDLLLTALALTLQSWNGTATQYITLEGHGREVLNESIDHSKTVGWFTTHYPVKLELQDGLSSTIKHIKERLRNIPNKGIGFGAIYPGELSNLPPASFNYLGQFDSRDDYWQVTGEGSGMEIHTDNTDSNIISINGMVVDGRLGFHIITALGEKQTDQLAGAFQNFLEDVIWHCEEVIQQGSAQYTPSDFGTVTISQALLDKLQ